MVSSRMISESVEIAAPPERVREVFLDFAKLPEWHSQHFKSVELPSPKKQGSELEKGDKLKIVMESMTFSPIILENSANKLQWRGGNWYIVQGDHSFEFQPSKITPGHTTFVQYENCSGLFTVFFSSEPKQIPGFNALNNDLKKRVESL